MKNNFLFAQGLSVIFLKNKCRTYFKKNYDLDVYFPGYLNFYWPKNLHNKKIIDVVLFGNAVHLLSNTYIWPNFNSYRIWVISKTHKTLLMKLFHLKENQIGYIPRNHIEKKAKINYKIDPNSSLDFVMSSRLVDEKNNDFAIHFINRLQHLHSRPVRLTIFYPQIGNSTIKDLVNQFQWINKPIIKADQGFHWYKMIDKKKPILINTSTSFFEDFSVSTMQAQEKGWPVLSAEWGVFRELNKPNHYFMPFKFFREYYSTKNKRQKNVIINKAVNFFINDVKTSKELQLLKPDDLIFPDPIKTSLLKEIQQSWNSKILAEMVYTFADKKGGTATSTFGRKLERIFSSSLRKKNV